MDHTTKDLQPKKFSQAENKNQSNLQRRGNGNTSRKDKIVHRFKIKESPEYPCVNGNQTMDHLLYNCSKQNNEREKLIAYISKEDNWPTKKSELLNKYLKQLINFANYLDYGKL